jgi:hypothetical protein
LTQSIGENPCLIRLKKNTSAESKTKILYPMVKVTNPPIQLPFNLPFSFIEKDSTEAKEHITLQKVINDLAVLSGKNKNDSFYIDCL